MQASVGGNGVAETYSHSRLASFEDCPRKYQYRYLMKIPSETESVEGFVGKVVHDVLERLYEVVGERGVPSLPKVIARYRQLFDERYDPKRVRIVRRENPLSFYRELGDHCLTNYYHDHYPFDGTETLGLEEHVRFELGNIDATDPIYIQGYVDRVARTPDGVIEIQDYKTGARVPSQAKLDEDRQLALYQIALSDQYPEGQSFRLVWHYLQRGRTITSTRSAEQLRRLREDTLALVTRIRGTESFETRPSPLCRWCEFGSRCPGNRERDPELPTWEETWVPPEAQPQSANSQAPGDDSQLALPLASSTKGMTAPG